MFDGAFCLDAKLDIVAISPAQETHPLDLLDRESSDLLFLVAHKAKSPDATPIGENDVLAIGFQLPSGLFILDTSIVVLKLGIAFLPRPVFAAVVIEARNGK